MGPLPRKNARDEGLITLARTSLDKSFRTAGTASWPEALCSWIAESLDNSFAASKAAPSFAPVPSEEGENATQVAGKSDYFPITKAVDNFWIGGKGPARTTYALGRSYAYNDGAGLTSPGRWF